MIDIIYYKLSDVSGCVLSLKTLIFYIYWMRVTMQYNQTIIHNLFLLYDNQSLCFFLILKVFYCFQPRRPQGDPCRLHRGSTIGSPQILLI
jgi:hypothetical protein